jgi:multiple sugar transport system permease protein
MRGRYRGPDYSRRGYLFLLPNFLGFMSFVFLPVLASLALSFCRWHIAEKHAAIEWIGLANFVKMFRQADFWYYVYNTSFLMLGIPVGMALSLALALLLNRGVRLIRLYRLVYFLPTISAGVALLVLWVWIYDPVYGLFNYLLLKLGVQGPNWLRGGITVGGTGPTPGRSFVTLPGLCCGRPRFSSSPSVSSAVSRAVFKRPTS